MKQVESIQRNDDSTVEAYVDGGEKSRECDADKRWVTAASLGAAVLLSVALSSISLGVWP